MNQYINGIIAGILGLKSKKSGSFTTLYKGQTLRIQYLYGQQYLTILIFIDRENYPIKSPIATLKYNYDYIPLLRD